MLLDLVGKLCLVTGPQRPFLTHYFSLVRNVVRQVFSYVYGKIHQFYRYKREQNYEQQYVGK